MKKLTKYLSYDLIYALGELDNVNEIRIKRDSRVVIKSGKINRILDIVIKSEEFDGIVDRLLEHSYHSMLPQIIEGYISLGDGYRVGIAGQAVTNGGAVTNLSEIGSVCIRVPHLIRGICEPLISWLMKTEYLRGVLIYSPPGEGKTTLLRDLIIRLCDTPIYKRVALIDSRKEIYLPIMSRYPMLDVYSGYPKEIGIELAIRTMSPDIIVCDEIGNDRDTDAILSNVSAGVPIIATAHGSEYECIIKRSNIRRLDSSGVFGCYVGISRKENSRKYDFTITEEIDAV